MRAASVLVVLAFAASWSNPAQAQDCAPRGRRCSTPPARPGAAKTAAERAVAAAARLGPGERIVVPLVYHVVYDAYWPAGTVEPDDLEHAPPLTLVDRQTRVLKRAFRGTGISFVSEDAQVQTFDAWRTTSAPAGPPLIAELAAMMREATEERPSALHVFLLRGVENVAASPQTKEIFEGFPDTDGIMMNRDYLPYDPTLHPVDDVVVRSLHKEGDMLVHLVGHYLGLLHTFQPGAGEEDACEPRCAQITDYVRDTPTHRFPANEVLNLCLPMDTCERHPGLDPVHNYMNLMSDLCASELTPGQVKRMEHMVRALRCHFIAPRPASCR